MSSLWILLKLMNCDIVLLNCGWIHDYMLWMLLSVVDNVNSWFGCWWVELLLKFWCFKINQFNCCISHFKCCKKSLFDVFEPWDKLLNTLGEWGIQISTFGVIWKETRGQTIQIRTFRSAGAWSGALGTQFQRASTWAGASAPFWRPAPRALLCAIFHHFRF